MLRLKTLSIAGLAGEFERIRNDQKYELIGVSGIWMAVLLADGVEDDD